MTHPLRPGARGAARTLTLSMLLLAACQSPPQTSRPDEVPSAPPGVPSLPGSLRIPPGRPVPRDEGPNLVRPEWDGSRKVPVASRPLAYPTTWKGDLTVRDLAMVGATLYTLDRTLQAVPLAGGAWTAVPFGGVSGLTRMTSDGQHLFAGTASGQVLGLDPANSRHATLATLPSAVTGLAVGDGGLWVGTERDGVFRLPVAGGTPRALDAGGGRRIQDVALGDQVVYTLGDRLYAWPTDGSPAREVAGSAGTTAITAHRGVLYAGTADGWLLRSRDRGLTLQALGRVADTPLETLGTDGAWLYAGTGNTTYMLDLKRYVPSLCHAGLPATVTSLTVLDGSTVLVGTRAKGLTSMPR